MTSVFPASPVLESATTSPVGCEIQATSSHYDCQDVMIRRKGTLARAWCPTAGRAAAPPKRRSRRQRCLSRARPRVNVPAMSVAPSSTPRLPSHPDTSLRGAMRALASLLPDANLSVPGDSAFESVPLPSEPARTISTILIEDGPMRAHRVFEPPVSGFTAFLDGTQASRVLYASEMGVPVVHGTVAA